MSQEVKCKAYEGDSVVVPADRLINRVSVYGVVIENDKVLLTLMTNGKYHFVGGGIEESEMPHEALMREGIEESGLVLRMGEFVGYEKNFFYFNPLDEAYANTGLYHRAEIIGGKLCKTEEIQDDAIVKVEWIPLINIHAEMFLLPEAFKVFSEAAERYYAELRDAV